MSHVHGPAGGPFREDFVPCRECARREAEAKAAPRPPMHIAAKMALVLLPAWVALSALILAAIKVSDVPGYAPLSAIGSVSGAVVIVTIAAAALGVKP